MDPGVGRHVRQGAVHRQLRPREPATRLVFAVGAVKAAGLDAEARQRAGEKLDLWDAADIPSPLRGYVGVALENGLIGLTAERCRSSSRRARSRAWRRRGYLLRVVDLRRDPEDSPDGGAFADTIEPGRRKRGRSKPAGRRREDGGRPDEARAPPLAAFLRHGVLRDLAKVSFFRGSFSEPPFPERLTTLRRAPPRSRSRILQPSRAIL
jgi:hypothetical protein